ncbi:MULTISPECIES: hypothetical protein, partial [unclassified Sulfitobacter]|uniref:hypothetical protein n=1 Tax=unclassified Sulfitobacter TaxID=196795 RepID=UPI0037465A74
QYLSTMIRITKPPQRKAAAVLRWRGLSGGLRTLAARTLSVPKKFSRKITFFCSNALAAPAL